MRNTAQSRVGTDIFEAFFRECPQMAAIIGEGGRIEMVSASLVTGLGLSEEDLVSKTLVDLAHVDDRAAVEAAFAELTGPGKTGTWQCRTLCGDGVVRWLRWTSARASGGGHIFATAIDITSWQQEAEARKRVELRLKALVHQAPLGIIELDGKANVIAWNPAAEHIFGYTEAEAMGRFMNDLVVRPEDKVDTPEHARLLREHGIMTTTNQNTTKDGRKVLCEWHVLSIRDEKGEKISLATLVRDVTERARIEQDLQRSRDLLQMMLDNIPLALWTLDVNGTFTFSDGSGLARSGIKPGQLVGKNFFEVYGVSGEVAETVRCALRGEVVFSTIDDSGGFTWDTQYVPMRDADGELVELACVSLDVSERVRSERELRRRLEIIESQRDAIRALSTPIIEVWDGVLALPIIGVVDSGRAAGIMEKLLGTVVRTRAAHVLLDLTGVEVVDTSTADHLIKMVRALALLGAHAIVTGVRPSVARVLVSLGLELDSLTTVRNLRDGLKLCMGDRAG